jgi:hypothetical protein
MEKKQFMPGISAKERIQLLQENAAKVENTTYQKALTTDQLAIKREDLADNCIKVNSLEDELKVEKDRFKIQIDPLKKKNVVLLTEIKTRQTTVEGTIYHIADYGAGMMETFDANGELLWDRKLRPDEKQGGLFPLKKTAEQE